MKAMHKTLIVLAIIAVSGVLAYAKPAPDRAPDKAASEGIANAGQGFAAMKLLSTLDLTPEQKAEIRKIVRASAEENKQAQQDLAKAQAQLRVLVLTEGAKNRDFEQLGREIGRATADMAQIQAQILQEAKKLLTADQVARLEAIREEAQKNVGQVAEPRQEQPKPRPRPEGSQDTKKVKPPKAANEDLSYIEISDVKVDHFTSYIGRALGVSFAITNNGDRAIHNATVRVHLLKRDGSVAYEQVMGTGIISLGAGATFKPLDGSFYILENAPSDWRGGRARVEVIAVTFSGKN